MQQTILWSGTRNRSLEYCRITYREKQREANASVTGLDQDKAYHVNYHILLNSLWEATFFEIDARINNTVNRICFQRNANGNWVAASKGWEQFEGCLDIDISLTPFTNTLPINRLRLAIGQSKELRVLYIDVLQGQVQPVHQRYTRLTSTEYRYQNVPNDFEAILSVDGTGSVIRYSGLFERLFVHEAPGP